MSEISRPFTAPRATKRAVWVIVLSGAIAATTLTVADPAQAARSAAAAKQPRVFVVGDSLSTGDGRHVRRYLRQDTRSVAVDARIGRRTAEGVQRIQQRKARKARIWVIALGTNDAPRPASTRAYVKKVLRLAGKKRTVLWVNIVRPGRYGAVNRELARQARNDPRLHVVDWASVAKKHKRFVRSDGVHLTHQGYEKRARMTAQAVRRAIR